MRVALVDPAAFTPQYDHELAAALAAAGLHVELVTAPFRFSAPPAAHGYVRREIFYPLSSRLFRRSRARLPVKAVEHAVGLRRLRGVEADVFHVHWLPAPELDRRLLRIDAPAVFTAHDVLPRRTAAKRAVWRDLLDRFDRVVVHSDYGHRTLAELGVDDSRLRVIPHPAFASDPPRRDDGRTLLCLGVIRPYKGVADAVAAVKRIDGAQLLVAGDPAMSVEALRDDAGARAEWRLGYLPEEEIDRALGESTVAMFPYRPEVDQSGALLRALGGGVPAVAYDVAGIAEPIRRFGAGRVVPPGDVAALAEAAEELLRDAGALERARAGARLARDTLTWPAAAAAHVDLYRELT